MNSNIDSFSQIGNIGYSIPGNMDEMKSELDSFVSLLQETVPDISQWITDFRCILHEYKNIVVPLSGGIDSRIIFFICLDELGNNGFSTVTYGIEGALDYELAKLLSNKFQVSHTAINLNDIKLDYISLIKFVNINPESILPDSYINYFMFEKTTKNRTLYVSGFLGDAILNYKVKSKCKINNFLKKNLRHDGSVVDLNDIDHDMSFLRSYIFDSKSKYSDELINIKIRQQYGISKILFSKKFDFKKNLFDHPLVSNCYIYTPFSDIRHIKASFLDKKNKLKYTDPTGYLSLESKKNFLSMPIKSDLSKWVFPGSRYLARINQKLRLTFSRLFPRIFSVPVSTKNYIDDEVFFRTEQGRNLVLSVIEKHRNDCNTETLEGFYKKHILKKGNYGVIIWSLITLILNKKY